MSPYSVEDELKRHPELRTGDIDCLKEWLSKQAHLPTLSEHQLVLFLNSCDWSLERTKKTIEAHYTIRALAPEFFDDRDVKSAAVESIFNAINLVISPTTDSAGYRYLFFKLRDSDASKFSFCPMLKVHNMATDLNQHLHGAEPGYVFVYDVQGSTASHAAKVQFAALRKYIVFLQEAMPIKMKAIHIINCNLITEKIVQWVKPIMKSDLVDMIHLHSGSIDNLRQSIPPVVTPKDYGGELDSLADLTEQLKQQMLDHRDWFLEDQKLKTDETKRVGKPKTESEMFGLEGSFRKLDID